MCHEMEKIYSEGMESGEKRGELKSERNSPFHDQKEHIKDGIVC